MYYSYYIIEKC